MSIEKEFLYIVRRKKVRMNKKSQWSAAKVERVAWSDPELMQPSRRGETRAIFNLPHAADDYADFLNGGMG
jgi:hypothetical protein